MKRLFVIVVALSVIFSFFLIKNTRTAFVLQNTAGLSTDALGAPVHTQPA